MSPPRRVACLTMARDEPFFLGLWSRYYGGLFGAENLFVIDHASKAPAAPPPGVSVLRLPHEEAASVRRAGRARQEFDLTRFRAISRMMAGLLVYYDTVIYGDVDEILVTDPEIAPDLRAWLDRDDLPDVVAGFGLEMLHDPEEPPLDPDRPVLAQRRAFHCRIGFCKPHVLSAPVDLRAHGADAPFALGRGLYRLHLKYADRAQFRQHHAARAALNARGFASRSSRWALDAGTHEEVFDELLSKPLARNPFPEVTRLGDLLWPGGPLLGAEDGPPRVRERRPGTIHVSDFMRPRMQYHIESYRRCLPERFGAAPS